MPSWPHGPARRHDRRTTRIGIIGAAISLNKRSPAGALEAVGHSIVGVSLHGGAWGPIAVQELPRPRELGRAGFLDPCATRPRDPPGGKSGCRDRLSPDQLPGPRSSDRAPSARPDRRRRRRAPRTAGGCAVALAPEGRGALVSPARGSGRLLDPPSDPRAALPGGAPGSDHQSMSPCRRATESLRRSWRRWRAAHSRS